MNPTPNPLQTSPSKPKTWREKYDKYWNILYTILLMSVPIGQYFLFRDALRFNAKLAVNKDYDFPKVSDFRWSLLFLIIIFLLRFILQIPLELFAEKIMEAKFFKPENSEQRKIVKKKMAAHMFKLLYYTFSTVFAFIILRNEDYFPKWLLGHGELKNMYTAGYPNAHYFKKPKYMDILYLFGIGYSFNDMIYLIFIYKKDKEFMMMLLHHLSSSSLLSFSYIVNFVNLGTIVLFLHNETDVFVHLTRLLIPTRTPELIKHLVGGTLTINLIYMRIIVFPQCGFAMYYGITWDTGSVTRWFSVFLVFLYTLHVNWAILLLMKGYGVLLVGKKLSDTTDKKEEMAKKVQ